MLLLKSGAHPEQGSSLAGQPAVSEELLGEARESWKSGRTAPMPGGARRVKREPSLRAAITGALDCLLRAAGTYCRDGGKRSPGRKEKVARNF